MECECVNLLERFGTEFRITFDEAYDAKHRHTLDPWTIEIPCRFGVIYPHGGDRLAVECDRHPVANRQLRELGLQIWQDGAVETTFVFPVDLFEAVAAIVQPKRRRRLGEEHKRKLIESNAAYRFTCGSNRPISTLGSQPAA